METTQQAVLDMLEKEKNGEKYKIGYYIDNGLPIPDKMPILMESNFARTLQVIFEPPNKNYYIIQKCMPNKQRQININRYVSKEEMLEHGGILVYWPSDKQLATATALDWNELDQKITKLYRKRNSLTINDLPLILYVCNMLCQTWTQFLNKNDEQHFHPILARFSLTKLKNIEAIANTICYAYCGIILNDESKIRHLFENFRALGAFIGDMIKNRQKPKQTNKMGRKTPTIKTKKKTIPKKLKTEVWNYYMTEDVGSALCMCCKKTKITQNNFHCGHVIAEANGGSTTIANLKPICAQCNLSMGTKNMDDFAQLFEDNRMDVD